MAAHAFASGRGGASHAHGDDRFIARYRTALINIRPTRWCWCRWSFSIFSASTPSGWQRPHGTAAHSAIVYHFDYAVGRFISLERIFRKNRKSY